MRPGQAARRSHDYKRHGTTSLRALDIAAGRVIGKCYGRHRTAEFRKFLDEIEAAVPRAKSMSTSSWTITSRIRPNDPEIGLLNGRVGTCT